MTPARFFTDEDVYSGVASALRRFGFDAISTPECGRIGATDEEQLLFAAREERALVTFNVADFAALHASFLKTGRHHAGIVVSGQLPIGEVLRRVTRLAQQVDKASMMDCLEFLSDWQARE